MTCGPPARFRCRNRGGNRGWLKSDLKPELHPDGFPCVECRPHTGMSVDLPSYGYTV
jgi:hypothetical protein